MTTKLLNWGPALLLAAVAIAILSSLLTDDDSYHARAVFKDASGLRKNSEVKIDGVTVGKIAKISLDEQDRVLVDMAIDPSAGPLGKNARASLRAKNLLGAKLIQLDRGDVSKPAASGTEIPLSRTDAPVDLDEVLAVLSPDIRTRLRIFIHESGVALAGRGADFNKLLGGLPSALDRTADLVDEVTSDGRVLKELIVDSDRVLADVTRERQGLRRVVTSADGALQATADRHRELAQTIRVAPSLITQLRTTFAEVRDTVSVLSPAADRLRETAGPLTAVLRELPRLQPTAATALASVRSASPELSRLARGTTPFVKRLRATAARLQSASEDLDPVSDTVDVIADDTLTVLEGWARAIQGRDGLSHVFRGALTLSEDLSGSLVERFVGVPSRQKKNQPEATSPALPTLTPTPAQTAAPGAKKPASPVQELQDEVKDLQVQVEQLPSQVQDVLDGVLGGLHSGGSGKSSGKGVLGSLVSP